VEGGHAAGLLAQLAHRRAVQALERLERDVPS
jgi:hypothetical protein